MRLLRPTNQKLKVTLCLGSILSISACEPIVQSKGQSNFAGASLYGIAGGISNPGKESKYLNRNIFSGSAQGRMNSLNPGGLIQGETQLQKAETSQDENKSVLTADSRKSPSLKESKVEVRRVQCKKQDNRYIKEFFEQNFAKLVHWDAK